MSILVIGSSLVVVELVSMSIVATESSLLLSHCISGAGVTDDDKPLNGNQDISVLDHSTLASPVSLSSRRRKSRWPGRNVSMDGRRCLDKCRFAVVLEEVGITKSVLLC